MLSILENTKYLPQQRPKKIVLSFGLNNRAQGNQSLLSKLLSKLIGASEDTMLQYTFLR